VSPITQLSEASKASRVPMANSRRGGVRDRALLRQPADQDGEENDVVHAQYDFQAVSMKNAIQMPGSKSRSMVPPA
jgi:hypothetical protein